MPGLTANSNTCPFCSATFASREQTTAHLKNEHKIVRNQEEVLKRMESSVSCDDVEFIGRMHNLEILRFKHKIWCMTKAIAANGKEKKNSVTT